MALGHHARPRRRGQPARRGRLGPAGHLRRRDHRRRAAGPVQPERAGLEPAAVAAGPAGGDRVRALPADGLDHPPARRRDPGGPRDRAVPAVVDPGRRRADRGHLRPLRPRGDDRHPRAGGEAGRGAGGGGGPGHGGAVGADLPARARHPRHVDPVVRVRLGRRPVAAGPGEVAGAMPGLGDHPRPAADRGLPGRGPRPAAGPARRPHPVRWPRSWPPTRRSGRPGWTTCAGTGC